MLNGHSTTVGHNKQSGYTINKTIRANEYLVGGDIFPRFSSVWLQRAQW